MKSLSTELLDRATLAMAAALELYNKPGFPYRTASFSILATNAWELLLKSKWLAINDNNRRSLYIYEYRKTVKGVNGKRQYIKRTKGNAPFTRDIGYLARKLVERNILDRKAFANLEAMIVYRNSVIHFYNPSPIFSMQVHEMSAACVKNFVHILDEWFGRTVESFGSYFLPLAFIEPPHIEGVLLKGDEERFLGFLDSLETPETDVATPYALRIGLEVRFTKSTKKGAVPVFKTEDPSALPIRLTEENIREQFRWDYAMLTQRCQHRYSDFKANKK